MNNRDQKLITEKWEAYCNEINAYHREDGTWGSKENAKTYSLTKRAKKHLAKDSEVEIGRGRVTKNGKVSAKFGMNGSDPKKQCGRLNFSGNEGDPDKVKTRSCKDYPENYKESLLTEPETAPQEVSKTDGTIDPPKNKKSNRRPLKIRISKRKKELDEKDRRRDEKPEKMRELDKVLPGYADLKRLSRGIYENKEYEFPLSSILDALVAYILEDPQRAELVAPELNRVGLFSKSQIADKCRSMGRYSLADWLEIQNRQSLAQKGLLNKPPKAK